jgi:hypothetical protein
MKKTTLLYFASLSLLFSCNPLKKAYNKVAADIPANDENKAKLVPYFMFHFPNSEKETVIEHHYTPQPYVDTSAMNDFKNDFIASIKVDSCYTRNYIDSVVLKAIDATKKANVIVCPPCIQKSKETNKKDTLGNFAARLETDRIRKENNAKEAQISIINAKLTNAIEDKDKAENRANKMAWLLLLVFVCGLVSHWLRSKLF